MNKNLRNDEVIRISNEILKQKNYNISLYDLIKKMITASDNDATNTLVTRLGRGDSGEGMNLVNAYCEEHGFTDTSMGRLMLDFSAQTDNYTSAKDCAHFLQKVYNREITGSDNIFNYLKQQERTAKIPAGVPEGIETANKTLDDLALKYLTIEQDGEWLKNIDEFALNALFSNELAIIEISAKFQERIRDFLSSLPTFQLTK